MLNVNFKAMKNDYKKKPLKKETLPLQTNQSFIGQLALNIILIYLIKSSLWVIYNFGKTKIN